MAIFRMLLVIFLLLGPFPAEGAFWKNACARFFGQVEAAPVALRFESGHTYSTVPMAEKYIGEHLVDVYGMSSRQPVRYFKEQTRKGLEIGVDENGLLRKPDGRLLNTCFPVSAECPPAIFVMDGNGRILVYDGDYLTENMELIFHSSLAAGKPVASAGELAVKDGRLIEISNRSGHYRPSMEVFSQVLEELRERGVDTGGARVLDALKDLK